MSLFDLFDDPATEPMADPTLSVGELTAVIKSAFEEMFPASLWVKGETRSVKRASAGHVYLQLVDGTDEIGAVMWRTVAQRVLPKLQESGLRLDDGVEIRVQAQLDYYNGRVQLKIVDIDPSYTLGQLAADRDRLLKQLDGEGLLALQRLLPRPLVPLHIGLVTSLDSAAHHDFMAQLAASRMGFRVVCCDARMQGVNSARSVTDALQTLARHGVDVIALVRGGGSKTDLAAFDSERIARCIAGLLTPVMTGIGHEIDRSVADEVAHYAFKTPTAVAVGLIDKVKQFVGDMQERWLGTAALAASQLVNARTQIDTAATKATRIPSIRLATAQHYFDDADRRIRQRPETFLTNATQRLDGMAAQVRANSIERSLARGLSITRTQNGQLVRTLADAPIGTPLITTVLGGMVTSTITATESV